MGLKKYPHQVEAKSWEDQPIDNVIRVPVEKVQANDYNPNSVAKREMDLLYNSIFHDGYTQPVVTIYDPEIDKYVIVDGFHRYQTMRTNEDIIAKNGGTLPIVVIDASTKDRMASTVRHNRARGKHSIAGMGSIVFNMLQEGATDEEICQKLGLEAEELLRLKHITGFSKLFKNVKYSKSWDTDKMIKIKKDYMEHADEQSN